MRSITYQKSLFSALKQTQNDLGNTKDCLASHSLLFLIDNKQDGIRNLILKSFLFQGLK
jgi:hypothetical protein